MRSVRAMSVHCQASARRGTGRGQVGDCPGTVPDLSPRPQLYCRPRVSNSEVPPMRRRLIGSILLAFAVVAGTNITLAARPLYVVCTVPGALDIFIVVDNF